MTKNHIHTQQMLIATLAFSLMELLVKSLHRIPTEQIVFFRALVAFMICFFMIRRMKISFWGNNKPILFLRGLFGTVALILFFQSLKTLPLATAAAIQKLSPLFTLLFAQFFLKEKVHAINWLFFLIALSGALIIKGFNPDIQFVPFIMALLAAIGAGIAYTCIGKLKSTDHPYTVILYFPLITLPIITPSTIVNWVQPNILEWAFLIGVGLIVQFAQYFMTLAFSGPDTGKVSIVYYLGTVIAALWGYIFFSERLTLSTALGIAVILFGVLGNTLVQQRLKNREKS